VSLFKDISSLIFPTRCISCIRDIPDVASNICLNCKRTVGTDALVNNRGTLKIFAGSKYSLVTSRIILGAKERNQTLARNVLVEGLERALARATKQSSIDSKLHNPTIVLVPIPSRKAADRVRGFSHIDLLVAQFVRDNPQINFRILNCLFHTRKIRDQSTLNIGERELNMSGAFAIKQSFENEILKTLTPNANPSALIFIVDDLVTTGSTVQAAARALNHLGVRVNGVLASCVTDGFSH
jgi:predicted amidophosphoribosyltransferase